MWNITKHIVNTANTITHAIQMQTNKINLPVLKAWNRVFELLQCINDHPYDREGFQESVLKLYPGKSPKSVFRGMAVPTLRNLGFVLGYGDVIRISANGALVHEANQTSHEDGLRALRAILLERDEHLGIIEYLLDKSIISYRSLVDNWIQRINISNLRTANNPKAIIRASRERICDWIEFITFAELLYNDNQNVRIDTEHYLQARIDINPTIEQKEESFFSNFFPIYNRIVSRQGGINNVEVELLRKELALHSHRQSRFLLTEKQFDTLLTNLPKATTDYVITFGRSMGADEKLFFYQGKYYQTLLIRFLS